MATSTEEHPTAGPALFLARGRGKQRKCRLSTSASSAAKHNLSDGCENILHKTKALHLALWTLTEKTKVATPRPSP